MHRIKWICLLYVMFFAVSIMSNAQAPHATTNETRDEIYK